ncbi:ABC transporter ATP-binding protein [Streptomyces corynorhini]|uniref:ABC transporter ATP-binding protein n=1 Tax=Streptomyces corynorhini TaxID=2282652 RepID=A0A370AR28_9ACTN|nr:ABC transporter ATP-binding protein [Streptomyces corynorhini]RDG32048.1 ABC transporter ATP-binding protein [Streptomyces corynorhini]
MSAVETRRLVRSYPGRKDDSGRVRLALDEFDLRVERGEVHGLLGPNGAGKTTLCRILCTVLLPTSGTAEVLGHDVRAEAHVVRRSIGIVFGGERGLYGRLTARQNLRFWGALYGLSGRELRRRADVLLERTGLSERADDRVDTMSRGMKQRLHIARGLVTDPPVLILDEPTMGMDPVAAHDFREMIKQLRSDGRTVLLTTHDMREAEALCDRVTLVDHGKVIATEPTGAVGALLAHRNRVDAAEVPPETLAALRAMPGVEAVEAGADDTVRIMTVDAATVTEALRLLVAAGVTRLSTAPPGLEEVYLSLIGKRGMSVRR